MDEQHEPTAPSAEETAENPPSKAAANERASDAPDAASLATTVPPPPYSRKNPPEDARSANGPAESVRNSTLPVVLAVLSVVFCPVPPVGILFGVLALVFASRSAREQGASTKTTASKALGIIGIVLSAVALVIALVVGALFVGSLEHATTDASTSTQLLENGAEKAAAEACADEAFARLQEQDPAIVQQLADDLDAGFYEGTGYYHGDLGVDPAELATWMLVDFTYEIDGVYLTGNAAATAYVDVTMRDPYEFMNEFYKNAKAYFDLPEAAYLDEDGARAKMGEIYRSTLESCTKTTERYVSVSLSKETGDWTVDESSWDKVLDRLFGVY